MTLLCRSDATVSRGCCSSAGRPAGALTKRAIPTSCWSISSSRVFADAERFQRPQGGRNLWTVGVVARAVDVGPRRQEDDERHASGETARICEPQDGVSVDRSHVDVDARRQPHYREAHTPVDERDVQVQRAAVAGIDRQADRADVELALEAEGCQTADCSRERCHRDDGDDQGLAHRLRLRRTPGQKGAAVFPSEVAGTVPCSA
jgi:hypothetical protein